MVLLKEQDLPLVAIQCLVYNHEKYLRDCLEGFIMQKTNFKFIAIVHDDLSTDNSASIIKEYEEKYPDIIKPIFETENQYSKGGFHKVHEIMSSACVDTGAKYIALCEGDDYWNDPYKLQKQIDFLEKHKNVGLCYTDYDVYNEDGQTTCNACFANKINRHPLSFENHLLNAGYIAPMTWVYRSSLISYLRESMASTDGSFAFALELYKNSVVAYIDNVTAVYRIHSGSASHPLTKEEYFLQYKGVFDIQLYYAKKYKVSYRLYELILSKGYFRLLSVAMDLGMHSFVEDAKDFFYKKNISFDSITDMISQYKYYIDENNRLLNRYDNILQSYTYRIGKFILWPLKNVKRIACRLKL